MKVQHYNQKPLRIYTVMGAVAFGEQGIAEVTPKVGSYLCSEDFGQPAGFKFCTSVEGKDKVPAGDQGGAPAGDPEGDKGDGPKQFGDMTVAQLKAILAERKIEVPAGAKKADLVKLVEDSNSAPTKGEDVIAPTVGG